MTEKELIAGLKNHTDSDRREKAFKEVYDLLGKKIYNTCLNYLQNELDAEDCTQEVFVEVFRSAQNFKEDSSLSTWVYRIAINKCIDQLRSAKRKKRFAFLTALFNTNTGKELHLISNFDHPGIELEKKEDTDLLFKAIQLLPENQRAAFVLTQIEDHSQKEAAAILKITEKALESLVQRAKGNLRKHLKEYFNE